MVTTYNVVKCAQYNQCPNGHCELEVKAQEKRYGIKMCKKLKNGERSRK